MATYWEKLKDPRWQKRRLEILQAHNFECEDCGSKEKTLHVHHKLYRKGANPWEYSDSELACLCDECHSEEHDRDDQIKEVLSRLGQYNKEYLLGVAHALLMKMGEADGVTARCQPHIDGIAACFGVGREIYDLIAEGYLDASLVFGLANKEAE